MTDRGWLALYAAYVTGQAILRGLIGPTLELDEAEAFFFARDLAVGYNAQPPLYFWLQWGLFAILGQGIAALAVLKAALLWSFLAALHALLRAQLPAVAAGVAVLSLSFLPQVSWEAQRALTHSVLVLTMTAVAALVLWRVLMRGGWGEHLMFGAVLGAGLLSKYNFVLLPAGLLLAAATMPELRARLRPARLGVAALIGLGLAAPSAVWAVMNPEIAGASLHKLGLNAAPGWLAARMEGLASFAAALVAFLGLAIAILGPLWLTVRKGPAAPSPVPVVRWLGRGAAFGLALLLLGVVVGGATAIKDRWLLPVAWPLVPVAAVLLWPRLGGGGRRLLAGAGGGLWLVAAALLPWASLRDPGYRAADFAPLRAEIAAAGGAGATVVSDRVWILGNLAFLGHPGALYLHRLPAGEGPVVAVAAGVDPAALAPGRTAGPGERIAIDYGAGHRLEVTLAPVGP